MRVKEKKRKKGSSNFCIVNDFAQGKYLSIEGKVFG